MVDLSIVIPARNEADNLRELLPKLHGVLHALGVVAEVLVVDGGSEDGTAEVVRNGGGRLITQSHRGYGNALKEGFQAAGGAYLITMDADLSHEPAFIAKLWANRNRAEVVIASRYTRGGVAYMPLFRKVLSRMLNRVFTRSLALEIRDISSGFRLYRACVVKALKMEGAQFDVLPELIVRAHVAGWGVLEVPFTYFPRHAGSSQARIFRVGAHLANTFLKMWKLRNSIESADYDERAFYSWILPQRMWQRRRHRIITQFARGAGRTLDVGCGSGVILQSLNYAIGMDIRHPKMRYMRRYSDSMVTGSLFHLPFAGGSMDCLISSEVIEHVPPSPDIFTEMDRVLRPGGLLILGTPDYATVTWPAIEWAYRVLLPGGYADEHISHYTRASLERILAAMGYEVLEGRYVFGSELILLARKGAQPVDRRAIAPLLPAAHAPGIDPRPGICMLSSKCYASSDMGGGLERSAHRLCRQLLTDGCRVFVLTRNYDGLARQELIDGVEVRRFPVWGRQRVLASLSYLVQALWWLLVHRRDYHLIHGHQSYAPATIGACAKLLLGKPVLVKVSTADLFSERRELERLPLFFFRRWLLRRIDRFVVVNPHAREEFVELGIDAARIVHIPNGVPISQERALDAATRRQARARLGAPWERLVVFVGRLSEEKNLDVLLEAWPSVLRRHPDAQLALVGDGGTFRNAEPALRQQAGRLGVEASVHFVGRVSDVTDYLLAADLFVLPSSTEGMSNALLEAMAVGLPIVATRVPGNCELIRDEDSGLLVEPKDPQALAQAIIRLLWAPEQAARLGQAARETAASRFAIQRIGQDYLALYAELLSRTSNGRPS